MNDAEIDEILKKDKENDLSELKSILDRIEAGEKTTQNYYDAFQLYVFLNEKDNYKVEIENLAKLTTESAWTDIAKNNNVGTAYYVLSEICHYQNDKEKMLIYINQAIEFDSDNADFYFWRGRCYEELKEKNLAEKDYNKACELDSEYIDLVKMLKDTKKTIKIGKRLTWAVYLLITIVVLYLIICIFK